MSRCVKMRFEQVEADGEVSKSDPANASASAKGTSAGKLALLAAAGSILVVPLSFGQTIYVGPGYTTTGGGIKAQPGASIANPQANSTYTLDNSVNPALPYATGYGTYYSPSAPTTADGSLAYYWDSTNSTSMVPGGTPDILTGFTQPNTTYGTTRVLAVNNSAVVAGYATQYVTISGSLNSSNQAAIWTSPSTTSAATVLGTIPTKTDFAGNGNFTGINATGLSQTTVFGLNNSTNGIAVGFAYEYDATVSGGVTTYNGVGNQPVYWPINSASGTAPTVLPSLGTNSTNGYTSGQANAVNDLGVIAGNSVAYSGSSSIGTRPVIWTYNTTTSSYNAPTQLQPLTSYTATNGTTTGNALIINGSGITGGAEQYYPSAGTQQGVRPMRWQSNGVADQLQMPSMYQSSSGFGNSATSNCMTGLNTAGDMVGNVNDTAHSTGVHPFLWYQGTTNYTMLQQVSYNGTYATKAGAVFSINDSDDSVGYDTTTAGVAFASFWSPTGSEYNLYNLFVSINGGNNDGFTSFNYADSITNAGWISGEGTTTAGNQEAFLIDIPASATPEPTSLLLFGLTSVGLLSRRRK